MRALCLLLLASVLCGCAQTNRLDLPSLWQERDSPTLSFQGDDFDAPTVIDVAEGAGVVAIGFRSNRVRLFRTWDLQPADVIPPVHDRINAPPVGEGVFAIAFNDDESQLAVCFASGDVAAYSPGDLVPVKLPLPDGTFPTAMCWSPDGRILSVLTYSLAPVVRYSLYSLDVRRFRLARQELPRWDGTIGPPTAIRWLPNGHLVTASDSAVCQFNSQLQHVATFPLSEGEQVLSLHARDDDDSRPYIVTNVGLLTTSEPGTAPRLEPVFRWQGFTRTVAFEPRGTRAAALGLDAESVGILQVLSDELAVMSLVSTPYPPNADRRALCLTWDSPRTLSLYRAAVDEDARRCDIAVTRIHVNPGTVQLPR
jgi:WD40 repeat protein